MTNGTEPTDMPGEDASDPLVGHCARLRALRATDLNVLRDWWSDPTLAVLSGATVRPGPQGPSVEMFRPWGADSISAAGLGIECLTTGELVGHVTIQDVGDGGAVASLAVIVGPGHHGHGYEIDAVRLATRYGFIEIDLERIELVAWAYQNQGLAPYRALGFAEVARRRDVVFHDGVWHDQVTLRQARAARLSA